MAKSKNINRRHFLGTAATASLALTVVPRQVIGGPGYIPPSDKVTLGYIGCGTQGIREMVALIENPALQIVSVCDPNKFTTDYIDWSPLEIRNLMRKATGEASWGENIKGIPGGRDIGLELVQKYYAKSKGSESYKCTSYEDYRELLEKELNELGTSELWSAGAAVRKLRPGNKK